MGRAGDRRKDTGERIQEKGTGERIRVQGGWLHSIYGPCPFFC